MTRRSGRDAKYKRLGQAGRGKSELPAEKGREGIRELIGLGAKKGRKERHAQIRGR